MGRDRDVDFMPFYRLHRRAYAVYWDLFTPEGWEKQAAEYAAEAERPAGSKRPPWPIAQPGEMQPERDFNFQGEDSEPVRLLNRPGRQGSKWFSFDLPVDPARPMALVVTYHSDERKTRSFEILVDGRRWRSKSSSGATPAVLRDRVRHSAELTKGKQKVTVRFQATRGRPDRRGLRPPHDPCRCAQVKEESRNDFP